MIASGSSTTRGSRKWSRLHRARRRLKLGLRRRCTVVLIVAGSVEALTLGRRHVLRWRVVDMPLLHLHRWLMLRAGMWEELLLLLGRLRGLRVGVGCSSHRLSDLRGVGLRIASRWLVRIISGLGRRRRSLSRRRRVVMLRLLLLLLLLLLAPRALLGRRTRGLRRCPLLIKVAYCRRLLNMSGSPIRGIIGLVWLGRRRARRQRRLIRRLRNKGIFVHFFFFSATGQ
ncbi:hypothetical protein C8R43DRAFT_1036988 [Mycena crocata]|nr:hypothetical protein C8R43DRAFT_1036988 [Mycena crocata]